jgi:hypothetical protein
VNSARQFALLSDIIFIQGITKKSKEPDPEAAQKKLMQGVDAASRDLADFAPAFAAEASFRGNNARPQLGGSERSSAYRRCHPAVLCRGGKQNLTVTLIEARGEVIIRSSLPAAPLNYWAGEGHRSCVALGKIGGRYVPDFLESRLRGPVSASPRAFLSTHASPPTTLSTSNAT